jgi:hypothetical protein
MGFFKRRRERESAIPPSTLDAESVQTAPAEPSPTTTSPPAPPSAPAPAEPEPARAPPPAPGGGSIAEEVTAAAGGDLASHVQRLQALLAQHSVDLQSQPLEVRKKLVRDLNRSGVPAKLDEPLEVTDIQQVQAIESVLKKRGLLPEDADPAAA